MKNPRLLVSSFSLLFALSASNLYAEEHVQHGVHEHGVAKLAVAIGTEGVEITLASPAANIVGFEHVPTTDDDKTAVDDAVKKLQAGDELFILNAEAECQLQDTEVLSGLLGDEMPAHDDHKHAQQDDHKHDHATGDAHNDVDVAWSYTCAKPAELKEIAVKLFAAFPNGFQRINAEWVTDKGASAMELTQDTTISLTQ
ncbi:DUF2796 domain-containing protein [Candidatus Thiothrix anitrata]|uniref:DUF2796 domain-containing protein n=1 Tax=Candidatus Thiothrix anitrata TaxID=2823902 RepID=A0ABX7X5Z0_9GAMM|nr:DUF2796 domain-containing protein [Candidatus Thiothrix anitrata]QTR51295.1 DUF2796 domain-containing protein [Candidatus Thiothrix anitrata]